MRSWRYVILLSLVFGLAAPACDWWRLAPHRPELNDIRSGWFRNPRIDPYTQRQVDRLIHLSPPERRSELARLARNPPRDARVRFLMELALYKKAAWHAYLDRFTSRAELDDALVNSLIPVLRNMPESLKEELWARIPKIYGTLSSRNVRIWPPRIELRLAPKRAVDAFLQHTLKPDERMAKWVAEGATPAQAVDRYFQLIRDKVLPKDGSKGAYDSKDLVVIGRAIQKVLRARADELGVEDPVITIAGSFPNGRASNGFSDLDAQLSDRRLIELFPHIDAATNGANRARHPDAKLEIHAMRPTTTEPFAAQINPGMLRITKDGIEFLMYPPIHPLHRDDKMLPYNYPRPTAYLLDGKPAADKPAVPYATLADPIGFLKRNGYGGFPRSSQWFSQPESEPLTQSLVDGLRGLPPRERAAALRWLDSNRPPDPELHRILKLALYDKDAWRAYFDNLSSYAQSDDAIFHSLVPLVEGMPAALRNELVARIGENYPNFSRVKWAYGIRWNNIWPYPGKVYREIAPKRAMDIFLVHALKGHETLRRNIEAGASPLEAYDRYLSDQKKAVFGSQPHGAYGARDVLAAAKAIQGVLREQKGLKDPSIVIAGSFPAGRADLKSSDIDVMPSSVELKDSYLRMTEEVAKVVKGSLEVHPMMHTTTLPNAAIVSPVAVRVTPERIELIVYPTFVPKPGDRHFLPKNYPQPKVYVLD